MKPTTVSTTQSKNVVAINGLYAGRLRKLNLRTRLNVAALNKEIPCAGISSLQLSTE